MFLRRTVVGVSVVLLALFAASLGGPAAQAAVVEDLQQVAAAVAPAEYAELAARVNSFTRLYQVEEGDTITGIARNFRINRELLAAMNDLEVEAVLSPGQFLVLPYEPERTYEVVQGDTLWEVARAFGLSVAEIMAANGITNPRTLQVGTVLTLPEDPVRREDKAVMRPVSRSRLTSFLWPLIGAITSGFGWRNQEFHHGLDIAAEEGATIRAAREGTVAFSGWRNGIYGRTVILDHGDGYRTVYAHNRDNLVTAGEFVDAGEAIALVGSSGRATGPHLHFEIWKQDQTVNPLRLLGGMPDK
ncbi:peptidoglycan DD-metalloendopeptidase family protein [Thermanaeromonas sp. C210]|uniref:peptidoglycan DD-metalloendopeptidase family protein n=1 Tax=Thermanaeromonas sp. C210 TaxID=2731925 RepID=UPI00155B66EE|nr:M23 family metallopeptidase [Thermanaeromonas sp. C210]GFN22991.1 peptidase M23 [Thermanaeromonas sp. C210]